jgi:predicted anti-sigma-YlaC factor YlaD
MMNTKDDQHHDIGCLQAIEAFYAYLDGELEDPKSIEEFEDHMKHCRSCYSRAYFRISKDAGTQNVAESTTQAYGRI